MDDQEKSGISRRHFLLRSGAALMGLAALPLLTRTAVAQGKMSKQVAAYQDMPKNGEECSTCRFFIPPQGGAKTGTCQIVEGDISPTGYCKFYAKKS